MRTRGPSRRPRAATSKASQGESSSLGGPVKSAPISARAAATRLHANCIIKPRLRGVNRLWRRAYRSCRSQYRYPADTIARIKKLVRHAGSLARRHGSLETGGVNVIGLTFKRRLRHPHDKRVFARLTFADDNGLVSRHDDCNHERESDGKRLRSICDSIRDHAAHPAYEFSFARS